MDGERPHAQARPTKTNARGSGPDRPADSGQGNTAESQELACVTKLAATESKGRWNKSLTAEELLTICGEVFEPLFHAPPVGPIPEHLSLHGSVYGCVTEYEEKIEELDRWKAFQLSRWLAERVGKTWRLEGKLYGLQEAGKEEAAGGEPGFRFLEIRAAEGKPTHKNRR